MYFDHPNRKRVCSIFRYMGKEGLGGTITCLACSKYCIPYLKVLGSGNVSHTPLEGHRPAVSKFVKKISFLPCYFFNQVTVIFMKTLQ